MGDVSSQVISSWLVEHLTDKSWQSILDITISVLKSKLRHKSEDEIADLTEEHLPYVINILRDMLEKERVTGVAPRFELDEEDPPYIRSIVSPTSLKILKRLRKLTPSEFEVICADLLKSLGANATPSGGSDDGGIDFVGFDLLIHKDLKNMPANSKFLILGQAKRYKDNNNVTLNELRQFVGSCKAKKNDYMVQGKIGPLTPIIYAFWTTSNFDSKARDYAHQMGLWFMDGYSISCHIESFSIALPDDSDINHTEVLALDTNQ
ncbi:restriction endonuclease [Cronobacter sakazakii]|uniref:restriction endonuclease n=1 Tax=Cronobacter sakazakii TaxID=28141 RepID=UPI001F50E14B|nr:restriction endonuclease [Cronobacter sakazakii]EME1740598.1 restriction endonuclease [Cronobacter sakazakii]MCI0200486.1 restriction endonuclease [Cronobacter sakazakii]